MFVETAQSGQYVFIRRFRQDQNFQFAIAKNLQIRVPQRGCGIRRSDEVNLCLFVVSSFAVSGQRYQTIFSGTVCGREPQQVPQTVAVFEVFPNSLTEN